MNTRELYYFKTIADTGSVTKAAKKLYISQPSLSQFVRKLEDSVGTPLFLRTPSGMTLTYAGERLYVTASNILKLEEDFELELSEMNQLRRGRIHLGITRHLGSIILPAVLPIYRNMYPQIEIRIHELATNVLESELSLGHLDFAIMHAPPAESENLSLEYDSISRDDFIIAAPPDSKLFPGAQSSDGTSLPELTDLKALEDEDFIMVPRSQRIRQISEQFLRKAGIRYRISYEISSLETVLRCVSSGLGISMLPLEYAKLYPLSPQPLFFSIPPRYCVSWQLCIAKGKEYFLSKADQLFIDLVKELFAR